MTTKNPFPGMNPYFEQCWRGSHTMLIAYLRDALQDKLPPDLIAAPEEEVLTVGSGERSAHYRPNVQVREPWKLKEPALDAPATAPSPSATEPIRVFLDDEDTERWVEIRDVKGRLITVIDLLSPSNKLESADRDRYLQKRDAFMNGGVNVVEIDLLRQGDWVFPSDIRTILQRAGACYGISVHRAVRPGKYEIYSVGLRERLPAIRIPLRPSDTDVVLDLQPLIDQCHERGRYHLLNYRFDLNPPLSPEDDTWVNQLLRDHHLL